MVGQTRESEEAVDQLLADGALRFYAAGEADQLRQAIDEVLRLDPRSAFQRSLSATRGTTDAADTPAATFKVAFDSVEVEFAYPSHDVIRVLALRLRPPPPASTENEERENENEEDENEDGEEREEEEEEDDDKRTQTTAVS